MKQFTVNIQTTYNVYHTIVVSAINKFSANRIAKRWAKFQYFNECIHAIWISENVATNQITNKH